MEQSSDIEIRIGNRSYDETKDYADWDVEGVIPVANITGVWWPLNSSRVFQYIVARKKTPAYLSICELKLYSSGKLLTLDIIVQWK